MDTQLPEGWVKIALEDCVDILDSHRIPINANDREKRISGKEPSALYPYYGATGQVGWIDGFLFDEEIILLGEDGAPFLDADKDKAYLVRGKSWVNNHAHVLKARSGIAINLFLMHYLNHFDYQGYVTGTTRLKLNQGQMRRFPIFLPPLAEQERIVAKIEVLFSQLDAGVAALRRIQAALKRYKASVLKAACEGRLVPQDPADEPAEALLRRLGKAPLVDDDLPALPEGWCWVRVEQLGDGTKYALKAGPFGSSLKKEFYVSQGYKIYGQEQVIRGDPYFGDYYIDSDRFEQLKSNAVKPGDILISLVGTIGKVLILPENIEPGIINPRLVKLSLDKQLINGQYFKVYLSTETARHYFSSVSHGETMEILNLTILRQLPIPLPSLLEQQRIVAEIEQHLSVIAEVEAVVAALLARSARLRQAILKQAFEGKLV